ncbi:hypothetical protein ACFSQU_12000 [Massilia sp. GCM10020059]|uniref:Uncharacterized protein n=1 Tax=Massilia agrisoli TaxID=2892444 RepID=A0ABS8IPM8_9BURK|nr:hypothetical protein [Massilia agrisoli]MCC6070544.1 hypothetical protein [Massilia agrisoli]
MTEPKRDRLLIPDNKIIVVLDTAPVRGLAYATETPPWVDTFTRMAQQNYSFSLADGALSELLAQRQRNALSPADCQRVLERLQSFLNLQVPVLLGKKDLLGMLQVNEEPWSEDECRAVSLTGWKLLMRCAHPNDQQPSPEWALEEEREDWKGLFAGWQKILDNINVEDPADPIDVNELTPMLLDGMERGQDKWNSLVPPMSVRMHLQNRYHWRQFVRMQQKKGAYNPNSPKKRNDGIDADLYRYLVLPALIITEDNGFLTKLADIQSFQKSWLYTPQQLADEWIQGNEPAPNWPERT